MRICPPGVTSTRRQRIVPAGAQAPPAGLVRLILTVAPLERPSPLKMMVDWSAATTVLRDPSALERVWIMRGGGLLVTSSKGKASFSFGLPHKIVGSSRLTTQLLVMLVFIADKAHVLSIVVVSWNRTGLLRLTASARASCSPFWMTSAVVRIFEFCTQLFKDGIPAPSNMAIIITPTMSSIRVKPRWRYRVFNIRHPVWLSSKAGRQIASQWTQGLRWLMFWRWIDQWCS